MPFEVIDLCSSPEVPAPTKTTTATVAPAPTKTDPRPPPPSPPPARALEYDDVFDLTNVEDDDVHLPISRDNPALERLGPKASRTNDYLFLSDDLDITDVSFNDGPDHLDHRRSKKPRISGSPNRNRQRPTISVEGTREGPAVYQPASSKRWNAALDPIETTSSPLVPISSNERNPISSDPFASSPRQVDKVPDRGKDGEDPFASSPGVEGKFHMPRKRPASPEIRGSSPQRARRKAPAASRDPVGWDHISSSAPEQTFRDENWDLDVSQPRGSLARSRSDGIDLGDLADLPVSSDDEEFPDIDDITKPMKPSSHKTGSRAGTVSRAQASMSSTSNKSKMTAEERVAAREAEKRRKLREKEEAKEQRRLEKERAAALAEVNKVRTNKNVSTPEMMVDLPTSMNPSIRLQVETLLQDLNVSHHPYSCPVNNVVKWRRKVKATFNEDAGYWEPLQQERIEPEKHAMVLMTAAEFVELALGAKGSDIEAHVLKVQRHYEGHALIYLIEGLTPWMRKNRNVRNRQFQSAARNAGADAVDTAAAGAGAGAGAGVTTTATDTPPPPSSQAQGRRRKAPKPPPQYIDEDAVEDALLQLQVAHGAMVHHTGAPVETAQWVAIFTQHISTIPYRRQRDAANESAAFCMESGQVRTGDTTEDTYVRMLQEIVRVTAPIAHGIAGEYPTVAGLVQGLEAGGPLVLEGIRKSANRDGAFTDRTIGQAVSRRIHKVFLGRDEASTDI